MSWFEEEIDYNLVYYKILLRKSDNKYCVVCLQDFDEYDYEQDHFLKNKDGDAYKFYEKDNGKYRAKNFLNKVIKPEFIHEEDLIPNNENMYRIPMKEWDK